MNDRHPSGNSFPADPASDFSYVPYDTTGHGQSPYTTYENGGYASPGYAGAAPTTGYDGYSTEAYGDGDPLFGSLPGNTGTYDNDNAGYDTGAYDSGAYGYGGYGQSAYATADYGTGHYGTGGYGNGGYDTGGHAAHGYAAESGHADAWSTDGYGYGYSTGIPAQAAPMDEQYGYPAPGEAPQQWDSGAYATPQWDSGAHPSYGAGGYEPEATSYGTGAFGHQTFEQQVYEHQNFEHQSFEQQAYEQPAYEHEHQHAGFADEAENDEPGAFTHDMGHDTGHETGYADDDVLPEDADPAPDPRDEQPEAEPEPAAVIASVPQSRGRRRSPKPKRSALLTVAAPSVAVLGVAGIAAASVGGITPEEPEETTQAAPDPASVKTTEANSKLDTQLAGLSEDADDFADRASRTQERIDLKKRQAAEKQRKAEEAARREALRPKFVLPVEGAGISAYYGQAGVNWMSVHSGLDFPVSYGTPVKAATDGTVTTQWNGSYGNVAIVTAADGTETWYCHLSSTKIRSGPVQAGDVIAYSGNSGNSTGPHLHFEVRPGGGSAIDPLPWFRSHGLEPH